MPSDDGTLPWIMVTRRTVPVAPEMWSQVRFEDDEGVVHEFGSHDFVALSTQHQRLVLQLNRPPYVFIRTYASVEEAQEERWRFFHSYW